jgi:hypothetical protein
MPAVSTLAGPGITCNALARAIVRSDHAVDIIAGGGEDIFHQLESIGGPSSQPLIGDGSVLPARRS